MQEIRDALGNKLLCGNFYCFYTSKGYPTIGFLYDVEIGEINEIPHYKVKYIQLQNEKKRNQSFRKGWRVYRLRELSLDWIKVDSSEVSSSLIEKIEKIVSDNSKIEIKKEAKLNGTSNGN